MGLQVATSFETPQGFSVTSIYVRLQQISLLLRGSTARATVFFAANVSREKRSAQTLTVPAMPTSVVFEASIADCIRYEVLYAHIRRVLEARNFVCTPVLEDGQTLVEYTIPAPVMDVSGASPQSSESTQTTPPTPPPPSESPESSPEPQQPPSSEYAPAPAATEA